MMTVEDTPITIPMLENNTNPDSSPVAAAAENITQVPLNGAVTIKLCGNGLLCLHPVQHLLLT